LNSSEELPGSTDEARLARLDAGIERGIADANAGLAGNIDDVRKALRERQ